jgi:galactoside O-acetyltransferase
MSFYSREELEELGFRSLGENVKISRLASIHGAERITVGSNSRIDDFCVLSAGEGGFSIGSYVHIAAGATLIGAAKIVIEDFGGLSSRASIYSSNDDYSGRFLTNPTVPSEFTNVKHADVLIGKHVIIGSGSVVLPGLVLEEGVAVGALSLVTKNCKSFGVYVGNPARKIKNRSRGLLGLESKLRMAK